MKFILLIFVYISISIESIGQLKPLLSTDTITCKWNTAYSILIKHLEENNYLELVEHGNSASLPDTIPLGNKILSVNFIQLKQTAYPCFEVFAYRNNAFQYYLFEFNKSDIGIAGHYLFSIDINISILPIKEIEYFQNLYMNNNLLIQYTDNNKDGFEDIGLTNTLTSNVTWIYWNRKKGFKKQ